MGTVSHPVIHAESATQRSLIGEGVRDGWVLAEI